MPHLDIFTEYRAASDVKFATAKVLILKILDLANIKLIQKFFHKSWHYVDSYQYISNSVVMVLLIKLCRKGLNVQQAAFAVKIYKSHHQIGTLHEVLKAI
jgi:hypothetical protein